MHVSHLNLKGDKMCCFLNLFPLPKKQTVIADLNEAHSAGSKHKHAVISSTQTYLSDHPTLPSHNKAFFTTTITADNTRPAAAGWKRTTHTSTLHLWYFISWIHALDFNLPYISGIGTCISYSYHDGNWTDCTESCFCPAQYDSD